MPYIRPTAYGYASCDEHHRGAFAVDEHVPYNWTLLCDAQGTQRPTSGGYHVRPYPSFDVAAHAPYAASGIYIDHADRMVQAAAYALRDRLGDDREALRTIAHRMGFRHWRDAYNAVRNHGRRITGESGRDAAGDLRWRAWNAYRPTRQGLAATAATTRELGHRAFGIEVEFIADPAIGQHDVQRRIAAACAASATTYTEAWHRYGRRASDRGWALTHDGTVDGEVISDIMTGDDASMAAVTDMLRIVREAGGQAGQRQGMHVHHDVRDFTAADKLRLLDNLQAVQDHLLSYCHPYRRNGTWCGRHSDGRFDRDRAAMQRGIAPDGGHAGLGWNFSHVYEASARVEFRVLGWTLNGNTVRTWIRVGQALMRATKAGHTFAPGCTLSEFVAGLRDHGRLSERAATRFTDEIARRAVREGRIAGAA